MHGIGLFPLYLVAAYLGVQLITCIVVFVQVLRRPLADARVRNLGSFPDLVADQLAAVEEIKSLGFLPASAVQVESDSSSYPVLLLRHSTDPAFAQLAIYPAGNLGYPVCFYSFLSDGTLLATSNRVAWSTFAAPPDVISTDPYANSLASHWTAHQARLAGVAMSVVSDEEAQRRLDRLVTGYLPMLQARHLCVQERGHWHPSLRAAAMSTFAWLRVRRRLAQPYRCPVTGGANQTEYFSRSFAALADLEARRPQRHNVKAALLVVSICAALLLWGLAINWITAVLLISVLFFHESGHALMMRLYGYQDMSMFFIPFIGAVVTGKPRELPSWKQAVILFAGPVPGLLIGVGVLAYGAFNSLPNWGFSWQTLAGLLVGVNFFNLLPITPLDGGQLVEIAVFYRWPRSRFVFAVLGTVAIGVLAIWKPSPATIFIALILAMSLRTQYRTMVLQQSWREGLDRDAQVRNLFEAARRLGLQSFSAQAVLVKSVMARRAIVPARPWECALILFVLTIFWSAALGLGLFVAHPQMFRSSADGAELQRRV